MNKKILMLLTFMVLVMMATPLVPTVQAKITEINDLDGFTEYYGTMGGANFYVLIPDVWENPLGDGMLVVICRSGGFYEDPRASFLDYQILAQMLVSQGIAVAASNFGGPVSFKEGVICTHQLTMYVIDNYPVTGKVFLFGTSLGGGVALLLGERHPDIYSGVLDNSGAKDEVEMYNNAISYSDSDPFLLFWYAWVKASIEDRYGGTPEEKPNKYAKYSPTSHTDLAIPVISVVHVDDVIVTPTQTELYHAALSDPSLHEIVEVTFNSPSPYPIIMGRQCFSWYGHFDPVTYMTAAAELFNLIDWSNMLDP